MIVDYLIFLPVNFSRILLMRKINSILTFMTLIHKIKQRKLFCINKSWKNLRIMLLENCEITNLVLFLKPLQLFMVQFYISQINKLNLSLTPRFQPSQRLDIRIFGQLTQSALIQYIYRLVVTSYDSVRFKLLQSPVQMPVGRSQELRDFFKG